jgi:protein phosphatase
MALTIVEQAARTDVGRQRSANEDSFVASPPYFAVADGMGGANAGEVASRLAAEAFGAGTGEDAPPEQELERIAHDANRRIYELAARDAARRGMGTTLTAAMVSDSEVSIAHVGDSRAYRLRDAELEQITKDHSLVAELERSGQISPEAAENHPQRSIITRALGPEPEVEVDTYTVKGRAGDVYLLCSDGLTSMISDEEVASILRGAEALEQAADALVRAANQSGGKDNITVVLFRLDEEAEAETSVRDAASDEDTLAGQITASDVETVARPAPPASRSQVRAPPPKPAVARPERWPGRRRAALGGLVGLVALAAVLAGLYVGSRQVYFVGTNDGGLVTLYRGVPYELPFGIDLYEEEYASGVPARAIPAGRRRRVLDHEWRSREDAADLVRQLERGSLEEARRG